ncbi:MAG: hypothetical protein HQ462_00345 [Deltaproteobacteria bacterium]|nr:hypothetical protein [Deltaproteobacteria bacterium]
MKKFIFIVSFVFLGQLSLAEEPTNSSHANTPASQTAASATTVAQGTVPVTVDRSAKLFEYLSACLATRP